MSLKKLASVSSACLALMAPGAGAWADEKRVWTLSGLEGNASALIQLGYGVPETDDSLGDFRCKRGSGVVTLFVATTHVGLRPGRKATALLTAGAAKARIAGKLLPNEEAGVPSFEGALPTAHPVFGALAGGGTMTVAVGPSRQAAPLAGAEAKFQKFVTACARP